MATLLSTQSLNEARRLKKEEQDSTLTLFVVGLNLIYGENAIKVVNTDSNRELIIDVNPYLREHPDEVFDDVIRNIKNKITAFCNSNSELKFKYNGDSSSTGGGVAESKEETKGDGKRRKIKRSPFKKSIKSKRKY